VKVGGQLAFAQIAEVIDVGTIRQVWITGASSLSGSGGSVGPPGSVGPGLDRNVPLKSRIRG
jgi:hypothetical protein